MAFVFIAYKYDNNDNVNVMQNIALAITRGEALGMDVTVGDVDRALDLSSNDFCGVMVQYPDTNGKLLLC